MNYLYKSEGLKFNNGFGTVFSTILLGTVIQGWKLGLLTLVQIYLEQWTDIVSGENIRKSISALVLEKI